MLIAVISDTHMPRGGRRLPGACVERLEGADLILHAGDVTAAGVLEEIEAIGPPVRAVHGNQDEPELCERLPEELTWRWRGSGSRWCTTPARAPGARRGCAAASPTPTPWSSATPTSRCTRSTTDSRSSTREAPPTAAGRRSTPWAWPAWTRGRVSFELVGLR